jgi:hypothetical protein
MAANTVRAHSAHQWRGTASGRAFHTWPYAHRQFKGVAAST